MHHIVQEMTMLGGLTPLLSNTLFLTGSFWSTMTMNFRSLARQITLIVDGTTPSMQYFFTQWRLLKTSICTNLREFLQVNFSVVMSDEPPLDKSFTKSSMECKTLVRVNGQHSSTHKAWTQMSKMIKPGFLEGICYRGYVLLVYASRN